MQFILHQVHQYSIQQVYRIIRVYMTSAPHHYSATLCVSAVFEAVQCPSVRLSVSRDCVHTAEDSVEFLSWPGSSIILVF